VIIYESLAVQDGAAIDGQCKYVSSIDSIADVSVVASTAAAIISASDSAAYSHAVLHVDASS
jgi:hypothetical protein